MLTNEEYQDQAIINTIQGKFVNSKPSPPSRFSKQSIAQRTMIIQVQLPPAIAQWLLGFYKMVCDTGSPSLTHVTDQLAKSKEKIVVGLNTMKLDNTINQILYAFKGNLFSYWAKFNPSSWN